MNLLPPLLLLFLLPLTAPPQDPATKITPEEALARAVAAQVTTERAHRVEHFGIDLTLRPRGEAPREVDVMLQFDSRRGSRLQLVLDDSERGVRVEKGFDGRRYWLKEEDHDPILLDGRDFARDREVIDETLDLCEELLLLFDLERLQSRTKDLELGSGSLKGSNGVRPHAVLRGTITLADQPRRFALWLDLETWLPSRLTLEPPESDLPDREPGQDRESGLDQAPAAGNGDPLETELPSAQEFDLQHYHDFPFLGSEDPQGRLLPRTVTEYRRNAKGGRTEVQILELNLVQWRLPPRFLRIPNLGASTDD